MLLTLLRRQQRQLLAPTYPLVLILGCFSTTGTADDAKQTSPTSTNKTVATDTVLLQPLTGNGQEQSYKEEQPPAFANTFAQWQKDYKGPSQ